MATRQGAPSSEEQRDFQERVSAHDSVSDIPEATAMWQFLRHFGTDIDGLSKADQDVIDAIVQVDTNQIGREQVSAMLSRACEAYERGEIDVVDAAGALDAAFSMANAAFDAEVSKLLGEMSGNGIQALAKAQASASFARRQRRTRDWEALARDVPKLMHAMIPEICRQLAASNQAGGTQAPTMTHVFGVPWGSRSGGDASPVEAIREAMDQAMAGASPIEAIREAVDQANDQYPESSGLGIGFRVRTAL